MSMTQDTSGTVSGNFRRWARRVGLSRKLAFGLSAAAVLSGVATVATLTGASALTPDPTIVLSLLLLNAFLLLSLGVVIGQRLYRVWVARRRGLAGSRLHIRLLFLFSLVALIPAILLAIFSWTFLSFGIQSWFDTRVKTAVSASRAVAVAYLHEHRQNIRADAFAMANDLNREASALVRSQGLFNQLLSVQAGARGLIEALVMDGSGRVMARSELSLSLEFDLVSRAALEKASQGEIVVITSDRDDRVRAVTKLDRFVDAYLLVGRFVDAKVLEHIERTSRAVDQYESLEKKSADIEITVATIYIVVSLLLLLASGWVGLNLATQLVRPISKLIEAADRVRKGDLGVRVDVSTSNEETASLSQAFNRMTSQLESQQLGLMEANRQLDERRRFTETVLSGVSAGVIGLDARGRIHLPNRSASQLLATELEQSIGETLDSVIPEMGELLTETMERPDRQRRAEISVIRERRVRTLLVRMAAERIDDDIVGYVVTFDDITELQSAQRKAAWADIARRIAHEIKNPLTPIRLSAERLKRKYLDEITTDPDTFAICTDTIVRQVTDIGRMVDEFSSFARMPQPSMKNENLSEICRQAVFLERNRQPDIDLTLAAPETDVFLRCDGQQISQALTNILKNAAESVGNRTADSEHTLSVGTIRLELNEDVSKDGTRTTITVEDNGRGLPPEERERLTEPYVTTHDKGTGLGLAIVKKIMEDHDADLLLEDREQGGARVSFIFHLAKGDLGVDMSEENSSDPMKIATGTLAHGA